MNIVVLIKLVPDLVEEITVDESGKAIDMSWIRLIINEFDEHAIEQAILIKERSGAKVTIVAPDVEGVDDILFTAAAKGADKLIKIRGDFEGNINNHALARIFAVAIKELNPDMILTGVQSHSDLDGSIGPLVADLLGMPYIGYIASVKVDANKVTIHKEYPGGLIAEMEVTLPAVLGIQVAEQPPRYVAVSKVRQTMKTATIEELDAVTLDPTGGLDVSRMFQPETTERATIIEGNPEEIASKIVEIIKEASLL